MTKLSVGDAGAAAWDVFRRDGVLLAPVALLFFGFPGMAVDLLVPKEAVELFLKTGRSAPWMLAFLPILLLAMMGSLAIAAMVLVPRVSVGEALRRAFLRLPVALATGLILMCALLAGLFVAGLGVAVNRILGNALLLLLAGGALFAAARLLFQMPVIAAEPVGPIEALRRSWALTAGNVTRLLAFLVVFLLFWVLMAYVAATVGGTIAILVGKLAGATLLATLLASLFSAVVGSAVSLLFAMVLACLYRQAVPPS